MSFGIGFGDVMALYDLCSAFLTANKEAENDFQNIDEEVKSLQVVLKTTAEYLEHTNLSHDKQRDWQVLLKGCMSVLSDLYIFIRKYRKTLSFLRGRLVMNTIPNLRARLTSHMGLLSNFLQRFGIPTVTM